MAQGLLMILGVMVYGLFYMVNEAIENRGLGPKLDKFMGYDPFTMTYYQTTIRYQCDRPTPPNDDSYYIKYVKSLMKASDREIYENYEKHKPKPKRHISGTHGNKIRKKEYDQLQRTKPWYRKSNNKRSNIRMGWKPKTGGEETEEVTQRTKYVKNKPESKYFNRRRRRIRTTKKIKIHKKEYNFRGFKSVAKQEQETQRKETLKTRRLKDNLSAKIKPRKSMQQRPHHRRNTTRRRRPLLNATKPKL